MKTLLTVCLLSAASAGFTACATADETQAALIRQGQEVATAADCQACHTAPEGGKPFAGGYEIHSPMGTIYTTNITPSKQF
ncbi:cytochrome c, partial [Rahnella perminowiae]|nr:cytochrome c [Rahnella perminowiae]